MFLLTDRVESIIQTAPFRLKNNNVFEGGYQTKNSQLRIFSSIDIQKNYLVVKIHPGKFEDGPGNFWMKCYPMDLFSVVDGYVEMLVRDAIKPSGDRQDHSGT